MNMTNHDTEMLPVGDVPASPNGHSTEGLEGSRSAELSAQMAQEIAKLAQENAALGQKNAQLTQEIDKLAQDRILLQAILDNVPDNIYFKDRDCRLLKISKAKAQSHGVTDPKQVVGKTDFDFFTKDHAQQAYEDEQNIIRTGRALTKEERETWHDRPDSWVSTIKYRHRGGRDCAVATG